MHYYIFPADSDFVFFYIILGLILDQFKFTCYEIPLVCCYYLLIISNCRWEIGNTLLFNQLISQMDDEELED